MTSTRDALQRIGDCVIPRTLLANQQPFVEAWARQSAADTPVSADPGPRAMRRTAFGFGAHVASGDCWTCLDLSRCSTR
jgi:hypothetical protein